MKFLSESIAPYGLHGESSPGLATMGPVRVLDDEASEVIVTPSVAVVGLGYVGLTLAVFLASRGFKVSGVERNPAVLSSLRQGVPHFYEPGLRTAFAEQLAAGMVSLEPSVTEAWGKGNIDTVIISIGTPRDSAGTGASPLLEVLHDLCDVLKGGELVMLRSTVGIGTTRWMAERFMAAGINVRVAMCPERTVEGQALHELASLPQIIGAMGDSAAEAATTFFAQQGVPVVVVSSPEAAELAKLASNTFRDVSFAFANEIAKIAVAADVDPYEVITATNHDYPRSRIAMPGPVGGPCLEKDPWILAQSASALNVDAPIARAARLTNEAVPARLADEISTLTDLEAPTTKIAVLGLAFKGRPETNDLRGSPSMDLVSRLLEKAPRLSLALWDPIATDVELPPWGLNTHITETFHECLHRADVVVLMTNHPAFSSCEFLDSLEKLAADAFVIDMWPMLNTRASSRLIEHQSI